MEGIPSEFKDVLDKENDDAEKDFEPTIDMLMNEFHDETTLQEEEELDQELDDDELNDLTEEKDMPIEELMKMYGYNQNICTTEADKEQAKEEEDVKKEEEDSESKPESEASEVSTNETVNECVTSTPNNIKRKIQICPTLSVKKPKLESASNDGSDSEGSESDGEDATGKPQWWKKTTRVGVNYQCVVPTGLAPYDDTPPYQNKDVLVWENNKLPERETEEYLSEYSDILEAGVVSSKHGVIDNEQALYLLLQCGYDREEAIRRTRMNGVLPASVMSLWSDEEVRGFETGLKVYGKVFHTIKEHKVGTRSVGELVQFYYLWKKSDKQADFVNSFKENKTDCMRAERRITL